MEHRISLRMRHRISWDAKTVSAHKNCTHGQEKFLTHGKLVSWLQISGTYRKGLNQLKYKIYLN